MKLFTLLPLVAMAIAAEFSIPWLTTHQPNGAAAGQTNYYSIQFNVSWLYDNANTPELRTAYCTSFWGDNQRDCHYSADRPCVPYSTNVPTCWRACWQDRSMTRQSSFIFKLSPYFSIGNFTLEVEDNVYDRSAVRTTLTSSAYQITNSSAEAFACEILENETSPESGVGQHARGDCETPEGSGGFVLPVEKTKVEYHDC